VSDLDEFYTSVPSDVAGPSTRPTLPSASGFEEAEADFRTALADSARMKALYIDCGEKDQFNLIYGARRFVRRLDELGIAHRYEEFPDNHTGVDYRMDESLPFLAQALSG
jgi:hypothetical protein